MSCKCLWIRNDLNKSMKRQWPMYEPKSPMCASLRGRCLTCSMPQLWIGRCIQFGRLVVKTHPSAAWQTTDLPRGGIRVSDEPEKPGFRFQIPFYPPKTRVNTDFRVFMLDFLPKKQGKTGFSEHSEFGFIKMSLFAPPLDLPIRRNPVAGSLLSRVVWSKTGGLV